MGDYKHLIYDKNNNSNGSQLNDNNNFKSFKTTIYDESYNASPESLKACIANLLEKPRYHFFIFGSMQELEEISEKHHFFINFNGV